MHERMGPRKQLLDTLLSSALGVHVQTILVTVLAFDQRLSIGGYRVKRRHPPRVGEHEHVGCGKGSRAYWNRSMKKIPRAAVLGPK